MLRGRIFIVTDGERWQRRALPELSGAFAALSNYDQASGDSLEAHFSTSFVALQDQLREQCAFNARFELKRNGIIDIFVEDAMKVASEAPSLVGENNSRIRFGLAHQAYSFVKDIGHHHKHHSKRNDTITDLHEIPVGDDDRAWRRRTLYGIYRRVITYMRRDDIEQQISSIGLLAYAKSFGAIWREEYVDDEKNKKIPVFHDTEMRESISATEMKMRFHLQRRIERSTSFRTLAISGVSLLIAIVGIVKLSSDTQASINVPPAPYLREAAMLLVKYPAPILVPLFGLIYFFRIAIPGYIRPQSSRLAKFFHAALQAMRRRTALSLIWLISILLFGAGLYLLIHFR
jgi:hypothetical protein